MSTIVGIFGLQGTGKTMLMTYFGKRDYDSGKKIYSNYHLKNIDYDPIDSLHSINNMRNGVFLADELWLWLFSRISQSRINKELMKLVMLNRKRDLDIYYTAQLSRSVDVMLREVTQFFIYPFIVPVNNGYEKKFHLKYRVYNRLGVPVSKEYMLKDDLSFWGQYYDTTQEISNIEIKNTLQQGIYLEKQFCKALKTTKNYNHIHLLENSGQNSGYKCDVIAYHKENGIYAFDVKSCTKTHVFLNKKGQEIVDQYNDCKTHYMKLFYTYPNYDHKFNYVDPRIWNCFEVKDNSYIVYHKNIHGQASYPKFLRHSKTLVNV
jgi:hypothetical protein